MTADEKLPDLETITIYLTKRFGAVTGVCLKTVNAGAHGVGYRVDYKSVARKRDERLIIKTIRPQDFGHDYLSDRASAHLLANQSYPEMQGHIRCMDVVGYDGTDLQSLRKCRESFIVLEAARGAEYFGDFKKILGKKQLSGEDTRKADKLATHLAKLHSKKYSGDNAPSLYARKIRDTIGHGECLMGVFDTYSDWNFISRQDIIEIVQKSIPHWDRLKEDHRRLCQVHGDFHPGNIWFYGEELILIDRSRGIWGEASEDLFTLLIYYLFYALVEFGEFKGPFRDLFYRVYERYTNLSWDTEVLRSAPLFLASRIPKIVNPNFYPNADEMTRKRLIAFAKNVLDVEKLDINGIEDYLVL